MRHVTIAWRVGLLSVAFAGASVFAGCDGCGADAPIAESLPVPGPGAVGEAEGSGSGAAPPPAELATLRWRVEEVSQLAAVGECQAWDIAKDGTTLRIGRDGRVLIDTVSSTAPNGFLSLHEDTVGLGAQVVNGLVSPPFAFAMHLSPPPSVDQQASGGTLNEWRFGGEVAHSQSPVAGRPVDVTRVGDQVWTLSRSPQGSVVEVFALGATTGGPPLHTFTVGGGGVGLFVSNDEQSVAVPLFDAREVALFATSPLGVVQTIAVEMRPIAVSFHGDTTLSVVSGTDDQARVIRLGHGSDGQVITLPGAVSGWVSDGDDVIAISPATGSVWRLTGEYLTLASTHDLWPGHRGQMRPLPLDAVRVGDAIAVLDVSPGGFGVWWLDATDLRYRAHTVLDSAPVQISEYEGDALVLTSSDCSVRRLRLRAVGE